MGERGQLVSDFALTLKIFRFPYLQSDSSSVAGLRILEGPGVTLNNHHSLFFRSFSSTCQIIKNVQAVGIIILSSFICQYSKHMRQRQEKTNLPSARAFYPSKMQHSFILSVRGVIAISFRVCVSPDVSQHVQPLPWFHQFTVTLFSGKFCLRFV